MKINSCIAVLLMLGVGLAGASDGSESGTPLAIINDFDGQVHVKKAGSAEIEIPEIDQELGERDEVITGKDGSVEILLSDREVLHLEENSRLVILGLSTDTNTAKLLLGRLLAVIEKDVKNIPQFRVETLNAIAAVKGTEFLVETGEEGDEVAVADGTVSVGSRVSGGAIDVNKEQMVQVKPGQPPCKPRAPGKRFYLYRKTLEKMREQANWIRTMRQSGELATLRLMRQAAKRQEVLLWLKKHRDTVAAMPPVRKIRIRKYLEASSLTAEEKQLIADFMKKHPLLFEKLVKSHRRKLEAAGLR